MTWPEAVSAFAGVAFLWIWKQLHGEVMALRKWRHGLDGALPVVEGALRALTDRVDKIEETVNKLQERL